MNLPNDPALLRTLIDAAEDGSTRLHDVLDDLAGSGVLDVGAWGPKMRSRLELVSARLDDTAKMCRRRLARSG